MYTVCSLYLPHVNIRKQAISQLIDNLTTPFLLLGDMNAKSPLWGEQRSDDKGNFFEELLLDHPISILNDHSPTHFHVQTGTYSIIDLSISSSDCLLDFEYEVMDNLHDSDHYPIKLTFKEIVIGANNPERFNTEKANCTLFRELTEIAISLPVETNIDDHITEINSKIIDAANYAIPRKTGNFRRPPLPWWSDQCKHAIKERKLAERALKRNHTVENRIRYYREKAKCLCNELFQETVVERVCILDQPKNYCSQCLEKSPKNLW